MLEKFGFEYLAPFDILSDNLKKESVDIATSNAVFEHISKDVLPDILRSLHKCIKKGGAMCHVMDNSYHRAHSDKTISGLNFLKFSNRTFNLISGLNPNENSLVRIGDIKVYPDFARFSPSELAILVSYIVASK